MFEHLGKFLRKFQQLFFRVVRELTPQVCGKMYKWTVGALSALHEGSEARMITILEKANLAAIHTGRVTLMPKDVELAMKLSDATEHYKTMVSVSEKESREEHKSREENRRKELEHLKNRKRKPESVECLPGGSGTVASDEDDTESPTVIVRHWKKSMLDSSSDSEGNEIDSQRTRKKNVWYSKRLTKEQFDYFKQHGFTDELVTIVFDEGWDKVDIENYILLYNHQNNEDVPLPTFARQKDVYGKSGKGKDGGKKPTKCDEEGKDCEGGKSKGTDGKGRKKGVKSTYTKNDKGGERSGSGKDGNQKSTKMKNAKHGEPSGSRKDGKGEKSNKTKNDKHGEQSGSGKDGKGEKSNKTKNDEGEPSGSGKDGKGEKSKKTKNDKGGEPSGSGKDGKGEKSKKTKNDTGEKSGSRKGKKKDKSNETKNVKRGETSRSDEPGRKNTKDRDKGNKRSKSKKSQMEINDPIVHFGTNVSEASDLYREGRGSENSDGHGGKSDECCGRREG